ncbi:S-type pyocin domain-containing protein [Pseudomonas sp. BCRC 81390]|uniref:S-type pyocin domain-containing protein n=1 Tax=Pseudomonas sp. BCRC 81390 TaxID=3054778 RepID=UPI002592AA7B|nr:S-type pyocin domain-containing protein [Pseudomonas sp. BCRC 81390]MDM3887337.1 S-type pyocin domain-containing protein [Pseudomonas sp. BCRC 81390]
MSQHGSVELADSIVNAPRLPPVPQYFWGHNRIPSHYLASTFRPGHLVIDLVPQIEADKQQVKQEHNQQLEALEQKLDQAVLTQAGSLAGLDPLLAIERKLAAVNHLTAKFQAELQATRQAANQFFGSDPEHRSFKEFVDSSRRAGSATDPRQAWLASYRAAFAAKVLQRQIDELGRHRSRLSSERSNTRYRQMQTGQASQRLKLSAQTLDRTMAAQHEYLLTRSMLEAQLKNFERHQHDDVAEQAALAHARELELETSDLLKCRATLSTQYVDLDKLYGHMRHTPTRIDVTLKLDTARSPLPHKQELLDLKQQVSAFNATHVQSWPTEKANVARLLAASDRSLTAAFDEQLYLAALAGRPPSSTPVIFNAWAASTRHPLVLATSRGGVAHFESVWEPFGKLLSKAAIRLLESSLTVALRYAPLMFYSARLGDGERMGVTVPLASMTAGADLTQQANRLAGQTLELPLRMNAVPSGEQTEVYLVNTDGNAVLRDVRVRQAQWDSAVKAYRFTADGPGGATLLWHPATPPSSLGKLDLNSGAYVGGQPIVEEVQKHYPRAPHCAAAGGHPLLPRTARTAH